MQKLLEEVLQEAGYNGQIDSNWGGNSPVSSEVAVVQQIVREEEKKERQYSWVLRKQAKSTRQDLGGGTAEERRGSTSRVLGSERGGRA